MKRSHILRLFLAICLVAGLAWPSIAIACSGVPGDVNDDGSVDVADLVYLANYLWKQGTPPPCPDQADANGDCSVDVGDYVYLNNYIWASGPAPVFCY